MVICVFGSPRRAVAAAHARGTQTSSRYYYARLRGQPAAARRASSSTRSANGAFDTTETSSAPRDSNARSAGVLDRVVDQWGVCTAFASRGAFL